MSDDVKLPDSAPGLPTAASVSAEAPAAANEITPPVELRCRCGAEPHPDEIGICARGHAMPGNTRTLKHGRYAEQPPVGDDAALMESASSAQVLRQLAGRIRREVARSVGTDSSHRMTPSEQARALNMLERLETVESRIREMAAASPDASTGSEEPLADWPKRLALHFALVPDDFEAFIVALLEADMARCGGLRASMWTALTNLDPAGVPKWRGKPDEPDTVIL